MYNFIILFIGFVIIISLFIHNEAATNGLIYVQSSIDNRKYLVRNVEDKEAAADLLADMRGRIEKLLNYMKTQTIKFKNLNSFVSGIK